MQQKEQDCVEKADTGGIVEAPLHSSKKASKIANTHLVINAIRMARSVRAHGPCHSHHLCFSDSRDRHRPRPGPRPGPDIPTLSSASVSQLSHTYDSPATAVTMMFVISTTGESASSISG